MLDATLLLWVLQDPSAIIWDHYVERARPDLTLQEWEDNRVVYRTKYSAFNTGTVVAVNGPLCVIMKHRMAIIDRKLNTLERWADAGTAKLGAVH